mmetsp:Transcript_691/g.2602  ORF Transcript_691/g.2602 Transcript_691/m.2602 type:complete len:213 (-) Transcript_691:727-1365(-)
MGRHPRGGPHGRPPPPVQVRRRTGRHVRALRHALPQRDAERPRREGPRAVLPPIARRPRHLVPRLAGVDVRRAVLPAVGRRVRCDVCVSELVVSRVGEGLAAVSGGAAGDGGEGIYFDVVGDSPEPGRARVREGVAGGDDVQGDWLEDREIRRPVETVHEMALKSRAFSRLVLTFGGKKHFSTQCQTTFVAKVNPLTCVFLSLTASPRPDPA